MTLYPRNMAEPYYDPAGVAPHELPRRAAKDRAWIIAARRAVAKALIRAGYAVAPPTPSSVGRPTAG